MQKVLCILFLLTVQANAQNASEYFPSTIGTTWHYSSYLLDSLQRPVDSSKIFVTDSVTGTAMIDGKQAVAILTQSGAASDTVYYAAEGSILSAYIPALPVMDSLPLPQLQQFFASMRGWYQYLRFGTPPYVNIPYLLLQRDTVVTIDSITLNLRFMVTATRKAALTMTTPAGTFEAVPFEISFSINYLIGIFPVPIFKIPDTLYVARNAFVIREAQPALQLSVDTLGISGLNIPGRLRVLENISVIPAGVMRVQGAIPDRFSLEQNYPNPFNGITNYEVRITNETRVDLNVYDLLGKKVASLVEGVLQPGVYRIRWDARNISSGVYYARLISDQFSITKKSFLIK